MPDGLARLTLLFEYPGRKGEGIKNCLDNGKHNEQNKTQQPPDNGKKNSHRKNGLQNMFPPAAADGMVPITGTRKCSNTSRRDLLNATHDTEPHQFIRKS